jgi:hybrid cluster-associated redox disulfide protein
MNKPSMDGVLDDTIEGILGRWPKVSQIFINNRMGCIGCAFAKFHTLQDACDIYQLDMGNILEQMRDLPHNMGERSIAETLVDQDSH